VSDRVSDGRQELGEALGVRLPDDFGQLTVVSEDALSSLQTNARRINRATWLLVIVTAAFVILAVVIARNRRRAVIWLSIGTITALALAWWIIARIRQAVLDQITAPDSRAAIEALLRETRASFRTYVLVVLIVAAIAGLAAFVVAHLDDLARGRRWARQQVSEPTQLNGWVTSHYDGLRMCGFVVAAIALVWAGIAVVSFLVIGGLLGLYLLALGAIRRDQATVDSAPSEA
jgi:MFS family permease